MSFTEFPIPSVELQSIALDARNAIQALENTNAAINTKIAEDLEATKTALEASGGGNGAADAGKLAKFQAGGTLAVGQSINLSTENATVVDNDFIGVSAVSTPNQTRKSKFSTVWNYIKTKIESVALTLAGQLQLTGQSITNSSSALTAGLGDSRYEIQSYSQVKVETVSSSDTTPITLASITLPTGMYQIDAYVAAINSTVGLCKIGLRASSNIRVGLIDYYGRDNNYALGTPVVSDGISISERNAGVTDGTFRRHLNGIIDVITNNTTISIEFSQLNAGAPAASTTRKRAYIVARKVN